MANVTLHLPLSFWLGVTPSKGQLRQQPLLQEASYGDNIASASSVEVASVAFLHFWSYLQPIVPRMLRKEEIAAVYLPTFIDGIQVRPVVNID